MTLRVMLASYRLRAISRLMAARSAPQQPHHHVGQASPMLARSLCTDSKGSDTRCSPEQKQKQEAEGILARLLRQRDGKQNPLLAALGYYSTESRAIGAGNMLYKQALSRSSAAAAVEADLDAPNDFVPRFEMLSVHVYLTLRRLRAEKGSPYEAEMKTVMQCLFDVFWTDVRKRMMIEERGMKLIESGKWVKDCEQRFFGMALAFDEAWEDEAKFREALYRNVTCLEGDDVRVERFRRYMVKQRIRLEQKTVQEVCDGICWDDSYPTTVQTG